MDRHFKRILVVSVLVVICCGWDGFVALWNGIEGILIAFFPFIAEGVKQGVEDYLTSPYFITSVILLVLSSGFGIWVGKTGGKVIYLIISIATAVLSLVSIISSVM